MASANKHLEDAERRYQELFEAEKSRLQKKNQEGKDMIQKLQKKLRVGRDNLWLLMFVLTINDVLRVLDGRKEATGRVACCC